MMDEEKNQEKKTKNKKIIPLMIGSALLGGGIILTFNEVKNINNVSGAVVKEGIIPGYTKEQIEQILQRKADESTFSFEINSRPVFKNGKSEGNIRIANPPFSKYPIEFIITLDSNNQVIFTSPKLKPNNYIEKAKLDKELKAGDYNATATINAYDDKGEKVGTSSAKIVISVKE